MLQLDNHNMLSIKVQLTIKNIHGYTVASPAQKPHDSHHLINEYNMDT